MAKCFAKATDFFSCRNGSHSIAILKINSCYTIIVTWGIYLWTPMSREIYSLEQNLLVICQHKVCRLPWSSASLSLCQQLLLILSSNTVAIIWLHQTMNHFQGWMCWEDYLFLLLCVRLLLIPGTSIYQRPPKGPILDSPAQVLNTNDFTESISL